MIYSEIDIVPNMNKNQYKVAIIVPVFNAEKIIGLLLNSLSEQEYPKQRVEIIVVDNNSTDRTKYIVSKYPVTLLEEREIQSSYAARNRGIKYATSDVFVFTDADCIADPGWLCEGLRIMELESADAVGGRVEFMYSARRTAAELYDSVTNMQIENNINDRKVAKTANLFVKASVFEKIGLFPADVSSGGDVQWTKRLTSMGYKLVYAPEAIVRHPARNLKELLKKQVRVGMGMVPIWENQGRSWIKIGISILRFLIPTTTSAIGRLIKKNDVNRKEIKVIRIWAVSYLCRLATGVGVISFLTQFSSTK